MADQFRGHHTRISVLQTKTPHLARSLAPGLPPLQLPHPPHLTHSHHSPRSRFEYQINTECPALGFRFAGGIRLTPVRCPDSYPHSITYLTYSTLIHALCSLICTDRQ